MYNLYNIRFSKKCDLVSYLLTYRQTYKVIHRRAPLLKPVWKDITHITECNRSLFTT